MVIKILIGLGIIFSILIIIAIYSCFIISGKMSEIERQQENK